MVPLEKVRILGVDPGSRFTGYGCVEVSGNQIQHLRHGTLKLLTRGSGDQTTLRGEVGSSFEDRLFRLYEGLSQVIGEVRPQIMVVEKVFFAKNAVSALKLGQARGAIILTGKIHSLEIFEYSPTEVKQVITGYGRADKQQVARMVEIISGLKKNNELSKREFDTQKLSREEFVTYDASDGLALALCHAISLKSTLRASLNRAASLARRPSKSL